MDTNQTIKDHGRPKTKIKADMVKVNSTNMEDFKTHVMLAEMAQSICNRCNALTSLEQRISALKTSNTNVLQETRRFYNPAKQKLYFGNTKIPVAEGSAAPWFQRG